MEREDHHLFPLQKVNTYGSQINSKDRHSETRGLLCVSLWSAGEKRDLAVFRQHGSPPDKTHLRCLNRHEGICCVTLPQRMRFCFEPFQDHCGSSNIYHAKFTVHFQF